MWKGADIQQIINLWDNLIIVNLTNIFVELINSVEYLELLRDSTKLTHQDWMSDAKFLLTVSLVVRIYSHSQYGILQLCIYISSL